MAKASNILATGQKPLAIFRDWLDEDIAIESYVVLINDPRWTLCIQELRTCKEFAWDIETYSRTLDPEGGLDPFKGEIRLISVALPSGFCMVADLGGLRDDRDARHKENKPFLDALFARLADSRCIKHGQNLVFDQKWILIKYGVKTRTIRDSMLLSQVYWAGLTAGFTRQASLQGKTGYRPHGLGAIAERLGFGYVAKSGLQDSDWGVALSIRQINYSAYDSLVSFKCSTKLIELCKAERLTNSAHAECLASPGFAQMMSMGMPVDPEMLEVRLKEYSEAAQRVLIPFTEAFPTVNPNSPTQLVKALNLRYKGQDDWEEVENSDSEVLMKYESDDRPELRAIALYRGLTTQIDYLTNVKIRLREFTNPDGTKGFRVVGDYTQIKEQGMGRSGCRKPNLQNPANHKSKWLQLGLGAVRDIFKAPPGYKMIISDLASAHAQIATHASQDEALLSVYRDGNDLHCISAQALARAQGLDWTYEDLVQWAKKDKAHPNHSHAFGLRQAGKIGIYTHINLGGALVIQKNGLTKADPPIHYTLEEAKQIKEALNQQYNGLVKFQRKMITLANSVNHWLPSRLPFGAEISSYGEIRGLSGRRLYLQKWLNQKFGQNKWECKATDTVSHIWMSTEADAIKWAFGKFVLLSDRHPEWECWVCNFCHDEIDIICNEKYALEVATAIKGLMDEGMQKYCDYTNTEKPEKMVCDSLAEK